MENALILIDYINEICHPEGKLASCAAMVGKNQVPDKVNKLLNRAREKNWLIIWIIVGFDSNYTEANGNSPIFSRAKQNQALIRGTWGTELLAALDYKESETVIYKNAVNPFHATNLDHILRNQQIKSVYLAGVSTEVAIQSCTRDAHDRGYQVNVIADCCASGNLDNHNASIAMLGYMAKILSSTDITG